MAGRRNNGGLSSNGGGGVNTSRVSSSNRSTTSTASVRAKSGGGRSSSSSSQQGEGFHPKLITAQIVSMQCFHYLLLAFLFQINNVLYNKSITIDRIFTDKHVRLWHSSGWADVSAILLASLAGYVCLYSIVIMRIDSYAVAFNF